MDERNRAEQFAEQLRHCRAQLYAYIHTLVRNTADADDVFQQTALALWLRFDSYDPNRRFLNWALGVARLEAATWLRKRARDRLTFSDDLTMVLLLAFAALPEDESSARQDALPGCVDKLSGPDRGLLTACYQRGAEVPAVAARMGRSATSVYNSLRRIRRQLSECIERALARNSRD